MKNIRKTTKRVLLAMTLGLALYACDDSFLDIPAQGSLSQDVLSNKQGIRAMVIGVYGALDGAVIGDTWRSSPDNWVYGSVAGGDAHKGSAPYDQSQIFTLATGQATPEMSFFDSRWRALYEGISRANAVLKTLPQVEDMTEGEKSSAAAEARFLRGHFYFELKRTFNMVPWIDENTTDFNQPNDQDIWPFIEADFQFAMDNLPATQGEIGRANTWAAAAYLAKTYVYQEKWADAKPLYDDIIAQGTTSAGVPYGLAANFRSNFEPALEASSPEAVFAVQQIGDEGTGDQLNSNNGQRLNFPYNSPFLCCGFYQPTQDLVNSFRTDASGLPLVDNYNALIVTADIDVSSSEKFNTYSGELDPRLDWTVGRRGVPFLDWGPHPGSTWVRDQDAGGPYSAKKNIYWQARADEDASISWSPGTAINVNIIRFADVLLMAAEVEAHLGNFDDATDYVNRVRKRAANSSWVSTDQNKAYAAAVVSSEAEMLALGITSVRAWVVREDTHSTFVFLGGNSSDINNWQEYTDPNYNIAEYPAPFADENDALKAIYFERKLELALEGHRFFDLVRWGIAEEKLNAFFEYESTIVPTIGAGHFADPKNNYYPIPQNQINLSKVDGVPMLKQNPGYN
ncbi:MAG: RagB/SusD family nutrient uptake outer membrane protein [Bacteroidota bacterium]|nr:RagB/SusD family nutrient uptake outer membrane protein [Bacteroidota bacterium]